MDRTISHPIDMLLYRDAYGSPEMLALFSEEKSSPNGFLWMRPLPRGKVNWV